MQVVYFASPMCSWCWGIAPVIQKIKKKFANEIEIRLALAPFRIDTTEPMDEKLRNYVLGQWHKVHAVTSQPFEFEFNMQNNFVYNTTLACLAIKAFSRQQALNELDYFNTIQEGFYVNNVDVTNKNNLIELAKHYAVNIELFIEDVDSSQTRASLQQDFEYCHNLGVNGYPTLLGIKSGKISMLSNGHTLYEDLEIKINNWLRSD